MKIEHFHPNKIYFTQPKIDKKPYILSTFTVFGIYSQYNRYYKNNKDAAKQIFCNILYFYLLILINFQSKTDSVNPLLK